MANMRTIYPSENPRRAPKPVSPKVNAHKVSSRKWYSKEYLASVWAKRPAKILALLGFVAIVAILIMVFAASPENTLWGTGSGATLFNGLGVTHDSGVKISTDGTKVTLNTVSPLKPPVLGIIDESKVPNSTYIGTVNMTIVNADWAGMQPNSTNDAIQHPSSPCATGGIKTSHNPSAYVNPIDCRISKVRAYNATNPAHPLAIKIRFFAGGDAPNWAKNIGGSPLSYFDPTDKTTTMIGRFWAPAYRQAYANWQAKLAADYDATPELRDVTISGCMTLYAETFIRGFSYAPNVTTLAAAGYTEQLDQDCHRDQITAHQAWKNTRSSLSFNPFQTVDPSTGKFIQDESFTESMMDLCRDATNGLGNRCVLENNSIRYPAITGSYALMYSHMKSLGGPITFQTATPPRLDNTSTCQQYSGGTTAQQIANCDPDAWKNTLNWAVQQGATAVEVNGDYDNPIPPPNNSTWPGYAPSILAGFDSQLEANQYQ